MGNNLTTPEFSPDSRRDFTAVGNFTGQTVIEPSSFYNISPGPLLIEPTPSSMFTTGLHTIQTSSFLSSNDEPSLLDRTIDGQFLIEPTPSSMFTTGHTVMYTSSFLTSNNAPSSQDTTTDESVSSMRRRRHVPDTECTQLIFDYPCEKSVHLYNDRKELLVNCVSHLECAATNGSANSSVLNQTNCRLDYLTCEGPVNLPSCNMKLEYDAAADFVFDDNPTCAVRRDFHNVVTASMRLGSSRVIGCNESDSESESTFKKPSSKKDSSNNNSENKSDRTYLPRFNIQESTTLATNYKESDSDSESTSKKPSSKKDSSNNNSENKSDRTYLPRFKIQESTTLATKYKESDSDSESTSKKPSSKKELNKKDIKSTSVPPFLTTVALILMGIGVAWWIGIPVFLIAIAAAVIIYLYLKERKRNKKDNSLNENSQEMQLLRRN